MASSLGSLRNALSGSWTKWPSRRTQIQRAEAAAPIERGALIALVLLLAYFTADLTILSLRHLMLPSQAPPVSPFREEVYRSQARGEFESIVSRNPFSADGVIPNPVGSTPGGSVNDVPVATSLPIQLVGTLVHSDPKRSVATIALSSGSKIIPYRVGENMDGVGKVEKIERRKVFFRNRNAYDRLEFVEIKAEGPSLFGLSRSSPTSSEPLEVAGNSVKVKKTFVLEQMNNLPELLNQAATVPNFVPGSGGKINGFRIVNMQPGSLFEKVGLRKFDVIKGVNGETVDSAAKAMELYNQLKTSNQISFIIERDGVDQTFNLNID